MARHATVSRPTPTPAKGVMTAGRERNRGAHVPSILSPLSAAAWMEAQPGLQRGACDALQGGPAVRGDEERQQQLWGCESVRLAQRRPYLCDRTARWQADRMRDLSGVTLDKSGAGSKTEADLNVKALSKCVPALHWGFRFAALSPCLLCFLNSPAHAVATMGCSDGRCAGRGRDELSEESALVKRTAQPRLWDISPGGRTCHLAQGHSIPTEGWATHCGLRDVTRRQRDQHDVGCGLSYPGGVTFQVLVALIEWGLSGISGGERDIKQTTGLFWESKKLHGPDHSKGLRSPPGLQLHRLHQKQIARAFRNSP
ncbi:hypothetical protein AAFF_G00019880 [Aldrovandia affinis]|uniref:Uncharacterized protein n=1 Tax=Aldrovandia affinis TaxID=143900 RepID=A0AAD7S7U1_9TELE|nr:hypothetical protein AAFF_G00019880 [Aldrovandia affinis]